MRKTKLLLIFLIFVFVLISVFLIYYNNYVLLEVKSLPMSVEIVNYSVIGINLNSEGLFFDKLQNNGVGKRGVDIENKYTFPIIVSIKVEGNISKMITVSKNDFIISPGEKTSVLYYCNTGENELGIYSGKTTVVFRRAEI